jgi:hypothetical protein
MGTECEELFVFDSRWIGVDSSIIFNVSDKSRENQNTFYVQFTFSIKSCRLWYNVRNFGSLQTDRPQMTV